MAMPVSQKTPRYRSVVPIGCPHRKMGTQEEHPEELQAYIEVMTDHQESLHTFNTVIFSPRAGTATVAAFSRAVISGRLFVRVGVTQITP